MDRDECFKSLIRLMHKYIKMVHHLEILRETEEEPSPRSLQQGARWLGAVVVPEAPNTNGRVTTVWRHKKMAVQEP